jgi:small subunit ribosomal protein S16
LVKIRLRRLGKKKQPFYKVVAADSRAARTGKYIESIGSYNPLLEPMVIEFREDRLFYWLKNGAQPTDTVRSLLQRKGLWLRWDLMKKGADDAAVTSAVEKWQMQQAEKIKREAEKKARRKAARKLKAAGPKTEPAPQESKPAEETPA